MSRKVDLRVRRTRKLLRDALVQLMEQQRFETITVQAITDQAMINRATFYRHYQDKYDLLEHCMDDVVEELMQQIRPPVQEGTVAGMDTPQHNFQLLFEHVREHAAFYRVMLGSAEVGGFTQRIRSLLEEITMQRYQEIMAVNPAQPLMQPEFVMAYTSAAHIGAVSWWVNNDMPRSPAKMAEDLLTLLGKGTFYALSIEV